MENIKIQKKVKDLVKHSFLGSLNFFICWILNSQLLAETCKEKCKKKNIAITKDYYQKGIVDLFGNRIFYIIFLCCFSFFTNSPIMASESLGDSYKKQKECTWENADFKESPGRGSRFCVQPGGIQEMYYNSGGELRKYWRDGYLGIKIFDPYGDYYNVTEWQIENNQLIRYTCSTPKRELRISKCEGKIRKEIMGIKN